MFPRFVLLLTACLLSLALPLRAQAPPAKAPRTDRYGDPLPPGAVARLGTLRWRNGTRSIRSLRFGPGGQSLLTIGRDDMVRVWETATGKEQYHFVLPRDGRWALTPDLRLLVTTTEGPSVRLWDTRTGKMLRVWKERDYRFEAIDLTPDGKILAAVGMPEEKGKPIVRLWELPAGRKLGDLTITTPLKKDEHFVVGRVSFLAGGKTMVVVGNALDPAPVQYGPSKLLCWDVVSQKALPTLDALPPQEQVPVLSPDGKLLAFRVKKGKAGEHLRLLDLATGKTLRDLRIPMVDRLAGARFSPDGRTVAVVGVKALCEVIRVWDVASGRMMTAPPLDGHEIEDIVFSPDGRRIAVQEKDHHVHLCEVASGKKVHTLNISSPEDDLPRQTGVRLGLEALPDQSILVFAPDGKCLAVVASDNRVRLWDTTTGKEIRAGIGGHEGAVYAVAVSPDGKIVASVSSDGTARLWDPSTGREIRALSLGSVTETESHFIWDVSGFHAAFTRDGTTLAVTSQFNTTVRLWNPATGRVRLRFVVPSGGVTSMAFTADGKRLVTGGHGRVLSWDTKTGTPYHRFAGVERSGLEFGLFQDHSPTAVAISPDGRLLAAPQGRRGHVKQSGSAGFQLGLWELSTGKLRRRVPALWPKGRFDASSALEYGKAVEPTGASLVAFAPDGRTLAWNQGESIELLDVARGRPVRQIAGSVRNVAALAFSPAGDLLAIGNRNGRVRFVDPATGNIKATFAGHRGDLNCLAFSPDGRRVFTGGDDTTVLVWDVARILEAATSRPAPLPPAEADQLWKQLASPKGTEAAKAMARLQDRPREAVALLRARLRPVLPLDVRKVGGLVADLESDKFEVRQRAMKELEQLEERVAPVLRKRLAEKPPLEMRRRLELLLERLEGSVRRPEQVRVLRSIEVLETLGTTEALAVLRELASGAPEARLTQEVKASLRRLERRGESKR